MKVNYEMKQTQLLVVTSLMVTVVLATTMFTSIPLAQGYLNLGDLVIYIIASVMPLNVALIAAGLGSALADILVPGAAVYAIFTLFIKVTMVLIVHLFRQYLDTKLRFVPFFLASAAMLVLYGLVDSFLLSTIDYFWVSFAANMPQAIISPALASLLYPQYMRLKVLLKGV